MEVVETTETVIAVEGEIQGDPPPTTVTAPPAESAPVIDLRDPLTRPVYRLSVRLIDTYKHINKVM